MKNNFLCPYCKGTLNVKGNIVFSVKTHSGKQGLVFVSPELGDYATTTNESFNIVEGELSEFRCPICHSNLAAIEVNENLVRVLMKDGEDSVYEVLFSGIAGEHCTYVLHDREIEAFGENSHKYKDYIEDFPRY